MRGVRLAVLPAALLVLGCESRQVRVPFSPVEAGVTLAYENPSEPYPARSEHRFQLRVAKAAQDPKTGAWEVVKTFTSLKGQLVVTERLRDGGVALMDERDTRKVLAEVLPEGFPDKVTAWGGHGVAYRVVGWAEWDHPEALPSGASAMGVWVESRPESGTGGVVRRTLYLPGLGEVEAVELRGGRWVSVERLMAQGFTDAPPLPQPQSEK